MTKTDYKNRHKDVLDEASLVFKKNQQTIVRRVVRALPYGIEMAILAIAIPVVTARLTGWNVVWPGLVVVLGAVIVRISRDDLVLRARAWWADRTVKIHADLLDVASRHDELERAYREGESRLARISAALRTLEDVLRSDVVMRCRAVAASISSSEVELTGKMTAERLRADLKSLCKFVCDVLGASAETPFRCGILVQDPKDLDWLVPIAVYDAEDLTYVSTVRYSMSTDFSGQLLQRFADHRLRSDWKRHTTYVISDVDGQDGQEPFGRRAITRRDPQREYLKSIAGNVIYCRDHNNEVKVLGVINIDSRVAGAIREDAYRALQPYLFPAFRLFASRLVPISKNPDLVETIWRGNMEVQA